MSTAAKRSILLTSASFRLQFRGGGEVRLIELLCVPLCSTGWKVNELFPRGEQRPVGVCRLAI